MKNRQTQGLIGSILALILLAILPVKLGSHSILGLMHLDVSILSEMLLFAIAAMSVNLLLGYTGQMSFGNAAYFGLGAYGAGLSIHYWDVKFIVATLIGTGIAILGAVVVGPFLLRRRGIYFSLLTLAFGQVFYFIAYRANHITGGEDGMSFSRPYLGFPGWHVDVREMSFYYAMLILFVAILIAFWLIVRSPFGRTLQAIRQNELRVRYLGLDTNRFIYVALIVSAAMAGLAGALYGLLIMFAAPLMLDWHQSGDFVMIMILGGAGTIWGPLVGSFIYVIGKDIISTITETWQIYIGALFVICVLAFPRGLFGTILNAIVRRDVGAPVSEEAPISEVPWDHGPTPNAAAMATEQKER
ncbi:MAG TPA: branched-chain amino acid ABC transporter permease [Candidatus Dormibacteraeota bacterium]|nr:branched-chain amino acid ABC transporter permease [Candidatus Dormibacteraeota bacterium]